VLARHLSLLARFAARQLAAQRAGTEATIGALRADMTGFVEVAAIEEALRVLRAEQQRIDQAILAVSLIERVLRGEDFVPRL
jgi:hypothetical protein